MPGNRSHQTHTVTDTHTIIHTATERQVNKGMHRHLLSNRHTMSGTVTHRQTHTHSHRQTQSHTHTHTVPMPQAAEPQMNSSSKCHISTAAASDQSSSSLSSSQRHRCQWVARSVCCSLSFVLRGQLGHHSLLDERLSSLGHWNIVAQLSKHRNNSIGYHRRTATHLPPQIQRCLINTCDPSLVAMETDFLFVSQLCNDSRRSSI